MNNSSTEEECININEFDIKRVKISAVINVDKDNVKGGGRGKPVAFPKYFTGPESDLDKINNDYKNEIGSYTDITIQTPEIQLNIGGIPTVDENFRKTDADCAFIWLPLTSPEGKVLIDKVFKPLDEYIEKNYKKSNFFNSINKGKITPFKISKNVEYIKCVRVKEEEDKEEEEEEEEEEDSHKKKKNKGGKKVSPGKEQQFRLKAKFKQVYNKNSKNSAVTDKIDIKLFVKRKSDGKFINTKVKTVGELREYVPWRSTVKLLLKLDKFWFMGSKWCGFGIKCIGIMVLDTLNCNTIKKITGNTFGIDESQIVNDEEKNESDDDDDKILNSEDSDSEKSDVETKKKSKTKETKETKVVKKTTKDIKDTKDKKKKKLKRVESEESIQDVEEKDLEDSNEENEDSN